MTGAGGRPFVVAGLARPRSAWFAEVGDWAQSSAVPVTFLRCVSASELRRHLAGGDLDAVMVEAGVHGDDPALHQAADRADALVIVVGDGGVVGDTTPRSPLGSPRLALRFTPDELVAVLRSHLGDERRDGRQRRNPDPGNGTGLDPMPGVGRRGAPAVELPIPAGPRAPLVAVLGPGGCGASTVAIALAQGLAAHAGAHRFVLRGAKRDPLLAEAAGWTETRSGVVLADLAVPGSLAMYHDAGDVVPGAPELVEACRAGADDPVRRLLFGVDRRGYSVLLGCRSQHDRRSFDAAATDLVLDRLREEARMVVADTDTLLADDGPALTSGAGSRDDTAPAGAPRGRPSIGRAVVGAADLVLLCATAELRAIHAMLRMEQSMAEAGVPATRIVRVVNRSPRRANARAALVRDLDALSGRAAVANAVVPRHRSVERCHVTGDPLPRSVVAPLVDVVLDVLGRG